jgi:uncharacterized RDD family membrane protein YckC
VTEVVTGEAVVLDVPIARFPSRMVAVLLDMIVQLSVLAVVLIVTFVLISPDDAVAAGISVTAYALVVIGYSTVFETLSRGLTLGKMAFGLRVVSDDGGPERFRQALVRALTGLIEIWSIVGAPIGLFTSIVSAKGKRLGDMFAGTYVIQERSPRRAGLAPAFAIVPPPLLGWAQVAQTSRLSDQTAEAAGSYLRRFSELTDAARADLGHQLASAVAAQVSPPPPPGTPPAAYLAAVLAIRRDREHARLASQQRLAHEASYPHAYPAGPSQPPAWPGPAGQAPAWPPGGPAAFAPPGSGPTGPAPVPGPWTQPGANQGGAPRAESGGPPPRPASAPNAAPPPASSTPSIPPPPWAPSPPQTTPQAPAETGAPAPEQPDYGFAPPT